MDDLNLSIIILSYNTKDITKRCLEHLKVARDYCQKRLKNEIKVIVIDNGSEDGSDLMIKQDFPWVKLMALKTNTGFSKGNNIGLKDTKDPFILLLNSDVYLSEISLYKALAYFRVNLNCDVLGAKLTYASGQLQPSAGELPNPLNVIFWILGLSKIFGLTFHPKDKSYFAKAHQVGWVMGAFFLIKRKVWVDVGGFDENFFMYFEEIEWCKRIKEKGFKIWFVPEVEVVHLHAASSKFDPSLALLSELKGLKFYFKKHYLKEYFLVKLFLILGLILRIATFSILGKTKRARVYLEGLKIV